MPDPIKRKDADFDVQIFQFNAWIAVPANAAKAGLSPAEASAFGSLLSDWISAYAVANQHALDGLPLTVAKDTRRAAAEAKMRPYFQQMTAKFRLGTVSAAELTAATVPVPDDSSTPVAAPTTHPIMQVSRLQILQHRLDWRDQLTPGSDAKPPGVKEGEVRIEVLPLGTPPPLDPADFDTYTVRDSRTPNIVAYTAEEATKIAHIAGRWISTRGEPGPWSPVVSASVPV